MTEGERPLYMTVCTRIISHPSGDYACGVPVARGIEVNGEMRFDCGQHDVKRLVITCAVTVTLETSKPIGDIERADIAGKLVDGFITIVSVIEEGTG